MTGRVLIVDDERRILSALERTLRKERFEVLSTDSPRRALEILASEAVDVVLSDHKMPGMSGLDVLAFAAERQPRAVRYLITGWTEKVSPEALDAAGVRAMISKPWDTEDLKRLLRAAAAP